MFDVVYVSSDAHHDSCKARCRCRCRISPVGGLAASAAMVPAEPALGTRWPFAVGVAQGLSILLKIGSPVAQQGRQAHAERESRHECLPGRRRSCQPHGQQGAAGACLCPSVRPLRSRLRVQQQAAFAARVRQHHYPHTAPGAYDEFYLPRLREHEHLVTVRRVADILPAMRLLRANESQRAVSPTTAAASL